MRVANLDWFDSGKAKLYMHSLVRVLVFSVLIGRVQCFLFFFEQSHAGLACTFSSQDQYSMTCMPSYVMSVFLLLFHVMRVSVLVSTYG